MFCVRAVETGREGVKDDRGRTRLHVAGGEGEEEEEKQAFVDRGVGSVAATDNEEWTMETARHWAACMGHSGQKVSVRVLQDAEAAEAAPAQPDADMRVQAEAMVLREAEAARAAVQAAPAQAVFDQAEAGGGGMAEALCRAAGGNEIDEVRRLISEGADVSSEDNDGSTPLHFAAASGHAEVVSVLLRARSPYSSRNSASTTPLHWAANGGHAGHLEVAQLLLDGWADVNAKVLWCFDTYFGALCLHSHRLFFAPHLEIDIH